MEEKKNSFLVEELDDEQLERASGGTTDAPAIRTRLDCRACKHSAMVTVDPVTRLGKCPNCGKEYLCHIPF